MLTVLVGALSIVYFFKPWLNYFFKATQESLSIPGIMFFLQRLISYA